MWTIQPGTTHTVKFRIIQYHLMIVAGKQKTHEPLPAVEQNLAISHRCSPGVCDPFGNVFQLNWTLEVNGGASKEGVRGHHLWYQALEGASHTVRMVQAHSAFKLGWLRTMIRMNVAQKRSQGTEHQEWVADCWFG